MSYGELQAQLSGRGAVAVKASRDEKMTFFDYRGQSYRCPDKNKSGMKNDLADGYEMDYCLKRYCETVPASLQTDAPS